MKTRRRTVDSRSLLSENESLDTYATAPSIESSKTITPAEASALITTPAEASASITTPAEASTVTSATSTGMSVSTSNQPTIAKLKSDVWQYFERVADSHPLKAKCKTCSEQLSTPNYGTSSLKRHLLQRHNLQQFASNKVSGRHTTPIRLSKVEKKRLDDLAVKAIIKDSRAFGDFHKSGLKSFIDALKPGKILFSIPLRSPVKFSNEIILVLFIMVKF